MDKIMMMQSFLNSRTIVEWIMICLVMFCLYVLALRITLRMALQEILRNTDFEDEDSDKREDTV